MINVSESWTVPVMLSRAIQFLLRTERQGAVRRRATIQVVMEIRQEVRIGADPSHRLLSALRVAMATSLVLACITSTNTGFTRYGQHF